jgi:hypothetical protein
MTRRLVILLTLAVSAFGADLPSAESLMDRFVEVTGGQKAYAARKSEVAHGTVEIPAAGVKGTIVRYTAAPDLYYLKMEIAGVGSVLTGAKAGIAWEQSDLMGPRVKSGNERAEALREARFNAPAAWRELYPKAETLGEETVSGEDCYKISLTPTEGSAEKWFFSKKTGLAVKIAMVASSPMGDVDAESLFSDYKNFGGILTPTKFIERSAGQEIILTIQSMEINTEIPLSQFDFPEGISALLARRKQ